MHSISFRKKEKYDSLEVGITIETILRFGEMQTVCWAKVDTGSDICVFRREIGEYLEIDIETGFEKKLITLAGGLTAYGHYVELETLGLKFDSVCLFRR